MDSSGRRSRCASPLPSRFNLPTGPANKGRFFPSDDKYKKRRPIMRFFEFVSAEDQLALWKLISDNVWAALTKGTSGAAAQPVGASSGASPSVVASAARKKVTPTTRGTPKAPASPSSKRGSAKRAKAPQQPRQRSAPKPAQRVPSQQLGSGLPSVARRQAPKPFTQPPQAEQDAWLTSAMARMRAQPITGRKPHQVKGAASGQVADLPS
ncbi:MAG: hypothetical protein RI906_714 [Pseudomonadota bacterium]